MRTAIAGLLLFSLKALGGEVYIGDGACSSCHPGQFAKQSESRHARALLPIDQSSLPDLLRDRPLRERGGVRFEYERAPDGLAVTVAKYKDDNSDFLLETASGLLEWAFGAGSQGMTAVGRIDGRYFEHRVSYFPRINHPGVTLGHPAAPGRSARAWLGLEQDDATVYRCFNCHATGVERRDGLADLSAMSPGVRCERCHGPGGAHVETARSGAPDAAAELVSPPRDARKSVELCGQCHRLPEPGKVISAPEQEDPLNVRFQPMGLMASRCFQRSGTLSCVTCHDPHQDARTDAGYYVEKCLDCHGSDVRRVRDCKRRTGENCLPCHMAKTKPTPRLVFTDHRIRVRRD